RTGVRDRLPAADHAPRRIARPQDDDRSLVGRPHPSGRHAGAGKNRHMRRGRTILGALVCASILHAPEAARAQALDLASCVQLALRGNPQVQDAADVSASAALGKRLALSDYDLKIIPKVDGGLQGGNTTNQTYNMLFSRKLLATG